MPDTNSGIARAQAIADTIRAQWPEKAAEIGRAIAEVNSGKRDGITVTAAVRYRLEKFEGEIEPGKKPYEVIEGVDTL